MNKRYDAGENDVPDSMDKKMRESSEGFHKGELKSPMERGEDSRDEEAKRRRQGEDMRTPGR